MISTKLLKKIYQGGLVIFFTLLAGKLFFLTIVKGQIYRQQAEQNRLKRVKVAPPRGIIYDRFGKPLVENVPVYYQGTREISRQEYLKKSDSLQGQARMVFRRHYYLEEAAAHILGFLGLVEERDLVNSSCLEKIDADSLVGQGGIEDYYDCWLQGKPGWELLEKDTQGQAMRKVGKIDPEPGQDLNLNIDSRLQEKSARLLAGQPGAIIVSDPVNGQILALVSYPWFDPNTFTYRREENKIAQLLQDKSKPFLNRAISARFPPGSVFKLISGLAALEEGEIDKNTKIEDSGIIRVGDYEYTNWYYTEYGQTEGQMNIITAIKRSNDIFFYKLGEHLGAKKMASWAEKFGLSKPYGLDLPAEVGGFVPTPEWKEQATGQPWFLGNSFHLAIGQGDLALTPLGVNVATGVFANGGKICKPQLRKGEEQCRSLDLTKQNLAYIKEGMQKACSEGGTGYPFFDFKINGQTDQVACKTGTAEFDNENTHAWFTMFAPIEEPEIAITVFLEGGGGGADEAAPIAKELTEYYFTQQ